MSRASSHILKTGSIDSQPGQKRQRATTAFKDCFLSLLARRNKVTMRDLISDFQADTGTQISHSSAAPRLNKGKLYVRNPIASASLTPTFSGAHLNCCCYHFQWSQEDWSQMRYSMNKRMQAACCFLSQD